MEIIYFEVNDWSPGRDCPDCEPFDTWLDVDNLNFRNEQWLIENKIIVVETIIDMSLNYCVTAPKEWIEKNCPCILNSKFIREPNENNEVFGRFGCPFKSYTEENLGYWFAGWDEFENWEPKRKDKIES